MKLPTLFRKFTTDIEAAFAATSPIVDTPVDAISPRVYNVDDVMSPTAEDTC